MTEQLQTTRIELGAPAPPAPETSWDDFVSQWQQIDHYDDKLKAARFEILDQIETRFGDASIKQFAVDARTSFQRCYELLAVGRKTNYFTTPLEHLSWKHYIRVTRGDAVNNLEFWLDQASERRWTTYQLDSAILEQNSIDRAHRIAALDAATKASDNSQQNNSDNSDNSNDNNYSARAENFEPIEAIYLPPENPRPFCAGVIYLTPAAYARANERREETGIDNLETIICEAVMTTTWGE